MSEATIEKLSEGAQKHGDGARNHATGARKQLEREASNAKLLPNAQGLTPLFLGRAPPADGWVRRICRMLLQVD